MLSTLIEFYPTLAKLYELVEKNKYANHQKDVQHFLMIHKYDIKSEFNQLRAQVERESIKMPDETMRSIFDKYDYSEASWGRFISLCVWRDPSSATTKNLRAELITARPLQRIKLCLNYMENQDSHKLGFCLHLWKHFFRAKLFENAITPANYSENHKMAIC